MKSRATTLIRAAAAGSAMLLAATAQAGPVIFVDGGAAPGGDGSSWASAFAHVKDALAAAAGGACEIHIAQGTYRPDTSDANPAGTTIRGSSFGIAGAVQLMGGYAGAAAANPDDRDTTMFVTILSGDLAGDDTANGNRGDNALHVVRDDLAGSAGAVLDGLTISGGNANGIGGAGSGGGLLLFGGSMTINDCDIIDNDATLGGGVNVSNGVYSFSGCKLFGNDATSRGGGLYRGGNTGTLTIIDSVVSANTAGIGGGLDFFNDHPGVTIERCRFDGNTAFTFGGGVQGLSNGMSVSDSLFVNNFAGNSGGGIGTGSNPDTPNGPVINNCTLVENTAASKGGGIFKSASNSQPVITNTILWANSDASGSGQSAQIDFSFTEPTPIPAVSFSIVQGLAAGGDFDSVPNVNNLGLDPLFADPLGEDLLPLTGDENWALSLSSPAIDAGINASLGAIDLIGELRVIDGDGDMVAIVDMGAFEFGDTDGDGLTDSQELDIAMGSGCPNPNLFDSDFDGLSDGEEVALGTDPCNPDTDNDGVDDFLDPLPLDAGVTASFLTQLMVDSADSVLAFELAAIAGNNTKVQAARRNTLSSRIRKASALIDSGDTASALDQLNSLLAKLDGDPSPTDWMPDSDDKTALFEQIELQISLIQLL